jgi:hypothetical protein
MGSGDTNTSSIPSRRRPAIATRHVHQRVHGAYLVQLDAFQRLTVHLSFNLAEDAEDLHDALFIGVRRVTSG